MLLFVCFVLFCVICLVFVFARRGHFCNKIENFGNMGHLRNQTGTFATKKPGSFETEALLNLLSVI